MKPTREQGKNGVAIAPRFAVAGVGSSPYDDPMNKVLGLDAKTSSLAAWFGFTSGSTFLLVGLMVLTSVVAWMHTRARLAAAATEEIEVLKEDSPPPPPPKTEQEVKPEPAAPPPHRVHEVAPPPAPAQASKVLTQEPDPNEPVDLTGNTIVQGNADSYAGGFTSTNGTNPNAVRAAAAPTGVPGGTGAVRPAAPPSGPDRSRPASAGNTDWSRCPFPPEADAAQIDEAYVTLEIEVRPDGTAGSVRVISDPGNGFGREARQCAARQHSYLPALDHDGNPILETKKFKVHFSR